MSPVWRAVCSPFTMPSAPARRESPGPATQRLARAIGRALSRSAGVKGGDVEWRLEQPPTFDNQIATLDIDGD